MIGYWRRMTIIQSTSTTSRHRATLKCTKKERKKKGRGADDNDVCIDMYVGKYSWTGVVVTAFDGGTYIHKFPGP